MATVVTYSNPLDPLSRTTQLVDAVTSSDLIRDLEYDAEVYDIVIARNNEIVEEEFIIKKDDIVAVILAPKGGGGGGKSILRIVAMIAVMAIAGPLATGFMWAVGSNSAILYYAVYATVMIAGSMLVNAILPPATPDLPSTGDIGGYATSNTYSWNPAENVFQQGIALPKIFGTYYVTPPIISKYVETYGDTQYLNILYAVSDGIINSIDDITINDNPLSFYSDVSVEYRIGYNSQSAISAFYDTRSTKTLNQTLDSGTWRQVVTDGNTVSALTVCLVFPRGLYYANDNGDIVTNSVQVQVQYSANGTNWTYIEGNPYTTISNSVTSTFRRTFRVENLTPGQYYVRAKFYTQPASDSRHGSECVFEYIEELITDDFTYPNTSVLALRALATDQLSGSMPKVTMRVNQGTNNPADIVLAIFSEFNIPSERIDTVKFDEWRTFCNDNNYTCNIYFDQSTNLRKAIDMVATLGRARVEQFGSSFSVIMDKPDEYPVQGFMFGMGNILKDSFKEEFLPIAERANAIEVTYYDEDYYNEKTIVEVSNTNYDDELEENRVQLNLIGCTNREQAIRQAKYMLNCNRYLTNTVTFEADIDSLVCRFGDVIQVSHDVPSWGQSGRIVSGSTTQAVLDREVELDEGEIYYIRVKSQVTNAVFEKQILNTGSTSVVHFDTMPSAVGLHDIYSIGKIDQVTKLFRIVKIGTSGNELRRTISAIEYNDDVYADAEVINPVLVSDFSISQLRASDYIEYDSAKNIQTKMNVRWVGFGISYTLSYKHVDDSAATSVKVNTNFATVAVREGVYNITVTDELGYSESINYTVLGKLAPPEPVTSLTATQKTDTFKLNWQYALKPIDWSHYEIWLWYGTTDGWKNFGTTTSLTYEVPIKSAEEHTFKVYSVDTSGVHSEETTVSATPGMGAVDDIINYYDNGTAFLAWSCGCLMPGIKYEVRKGSDWDNSILHSIRVDKNVITDTDGRYLIKAFYSTASGINIYSTDAVSVDIDNSRIYANVVATYDDYSDWLGTKDSTVTTSAGYLTLTESGGTVSAYGRYRSEETITISEPQLCHCSLNVEFFAAGDSVLFDSIMDLDALENLNSSVSQGFRIIPYIAISQDGSTFSDFKTFYAGDYYGKAFKFALDLYCEDGVARPFVEKFEYTVDMPDRIESDYDVTTPADTLTVYFSKEFIVVPSVHITPIALGNNCYNVTNVTTQSFDITFYQACSATKISKTFNWLAKSY